MTQNSIEDLKNLPGDQETLDILQQDLSELDRLKKDFCDLDFDLSEISGDYLQDKYLIIYWQKAINLLKQRFILMKQAMKQIDGKIEPEISLMPQPRTYSTVGKQLYEVLPDITEMGFLDEEMVSGIGERMMKIDDISYSPSQEWGEPSLSINWFVLITLPTVHEIMSPV